MVEYEELMPDQLCVAWHLCGGQQGVTFVVITGPFSLKQNSTDVDIVK